MLNKLGNKSKQRLTTLAVLGVIAGVGYQVDTAQADTQPNNDDNSGTENTAVAGTANDPQRDQAEIAGPQANVQPEGNEQLGDEQQSEEPAGETGELGEEGSGQETQGQQGNTGEKQSNGNVGGTQEPGNTNENVSDVNNANKQVQASNDSLNVNTPAANTPEKGMTLRAAPAPSIQTGNWGTSTWQLDDQGILTIGAGTLGASSEMQDVKDNVTKVVFDSGVVLPWNCNALFNEWTKVKSYEGLANVDASSVNIMSNMFAFNFALESIDLSSWDMTHVNSMLAMFQGPNAAPEFSLGGENYMHLTSVKMGHIGNPYSLNLSAMFEGDRVLTSVDTENWDVSHAGGMSAMFNGTGFTSLDLSNWKIESDGRMIETFANMPNLTTINLENMVFTGFVSSMFKNDTKLTHLDLTNINSTFVTDELSGATGIKTLTLGEKTHLTNVGYPGYDYNVSLPEITPTDEYTGLWQFVGTGTVDHPNGPTYTAAELMATYDGAAMAGTYVWQKADPKPTTPTNPGTDTGNTTDPTTPDVDNTTDPTTPDTTAPETGGDADVVTGGDGATIDGKPSAKHAKSTKTKSTVNSQRTTKSGAPVTVIFAKPDQQAKATQLAQQPGTKTNQRSQAATLPQTGEKSTSWLATIAGVIGLSLLGLNWFKRQD
ncbi:BspA family leucine-rich repeat surface protein [Levilactobacillus tujiorum]|uniref:BspA family leucine-rich repeat surface protein n=1 Tax=Levilactobacillus tujiorum TaxID=2912243 RepID=UPI001456DA29|nr:BspA family leucine-rich repeat surface protein [Levilactobacillus tujiorum]NLR30896.1 BspA family leucine-rich repeat surface protein [Levilactobacillus tujiorum]